MNALSPVMRRDLVCRAVSVARYSPQRQCLWHARSVGERRSAAGAIRLVGRCSVADASVMRLDGQGAWTVSRA